MARSIHYTTRTRFDGLVDAQWALAILDWNKDGVEDPGIFNSLRDRAENRIDRELRQKYATPLPDSSAAAPAEVLDESVSDLADELIKLLCLMHWRPGSEEYDTLADEIDASFAALRDGSTELSNAKAATGTGKRLISVDSTGSPGTVFAGTNSDGSKKMAGF